MTAERQSRKRMKRCGYPTDEDLKEMALLSALQAECAELRQQHELLREQQLQWEEHCALMRAENETLMHRLRYLRHCRNRQVEYNTLTHHEVTEPILDSCYPAEGVPTPQPVGSKRSHRSAFLSQDMSRPESHTCDVGQGGAGYVSLQREFGPLRHSRSSTRHAVFDKQPYISEYATHLVLPHDYIPNPSVPHRSMLHPSVRHPSMLHPSVPHPVGEDDGLRLHSAMVYDAAYEADQHEAQRGVVNHGRLRARHAWVPADVVAGDADPLDSPVSSTSCCDTYLSACSECSSTSSYDSEYDSDSVSSEQESKEQDADDADECSSQVS